MNRQIKEIALELLEYFENSEKGAISKFKYSDPELYKELYSGICEDVENYRKEIENSY